MLSLQEGLVIRSFPQLLKNESLVDARVLKSTCSSQPAWEMTYLTSELQQNQKTSACSRLTTNDVGSQDSQVRCRQIQEM